MGKSSALLSIFLFLCSFQLLAQKPEIVLVAVFHELPAHQKCNWEKPLEKLLRYKPDAIAVEYMMPDDPLSLNKAYGPTYRSWFDSVMLRWEGKRINTRDSITRYVKLIQQSDKPFYRAKLWQYYYLNIDMGNADYQLFRIMQAKDNWLNSFDSTGYAAKAFLKNLRRSKINMNLTEFHNLVFPLASAMHMSTVHPTDDKSTYTYQSETFGRLAEALEQTPAYKKMEALWKRYAITEEEQKKKCDAVTFINRKEWLDTTDAAQVRIINETEHPDAKDFEIIWYYRNKSIAKRISEAVIRSKAKRMAVFYGNMHIYPLKMYLEEMGYKVKLLGDL